MKKDVLLTQSNIDEFQAAEKLLNYGSGLSLLWLLATYFFFPFLFTIYPLVHLFLAVESAREAHYLAQPQAMKNWQRNVTIATAFVLTALFIGFVLGGALPNVVPFLPLMLIAVLAISTIHLGSIWANDLYLYLSTNKIERTPVMKQQLIKSSMAFAFQATVLIATACALMLAIPFIQTIAIPVIGTAIGLNLLVNLYNAHHVDKTYKKLLTDNSDIPKNNAEKEMKTLSLAHTRKVKSDLGPNIHQLDDPQALAMFKQAGILAPTGAEPNPISQNPHQFFYPTSSSSSQGIMHKPTPSL